MNTEKRLAKALADVMAFWTLTTPSQDGEDDMPADTFNAAFAALDQHRQKQLPECDDSDVIEMDTQWQFATQHAGMLFDTEAEACAAQRWHRMTNGFDPILGTRVRNGEQA